MSRQSLYRIITVFGLLFALLSSSLGAAGAAVQAAGRTQEARSNAAAPADAVRGDATPGEGQGLSSPDAPTAVGTKLDGALQLALNLSQAAHPMAVQPDGSGAVGQQAGLAAAGLDRLAAYVDLPPGGSEAVVHVMVSTTDGAQELRATGAEVQATLGDIATAYIPLSRLAEVAALPSIRFIQSSQLLKPSNDRSVPETRAPQVQATFGANGAGVIVGVIDSGIDPFHPDFIKPDGTTRIKYLLDLSDPGDTDGDGKLNGPVYGGTVYTEAQLNAALANPGWFYRNQDQPQMIPDNDATGVTSVVRVDQDATISSVAVDLDIAHARSGDLQVKLTCPGGGTATLYNKNGGDNPDVVATFSTTACNGQRARGDWRLTVTDGVAQNQGWLVFWNLHLNRPVRMSDQVGHGTHVAGSAAGNGRATGNGLPSGTFAGMAPAADLIVVRAPGYVSGFGQADELNALAFIDAKAQELGRPYVINMSLGGHIGPHDGTSSDEVAIDGLVGAGKPGKAIVVAAGNEGDQAIHAGGNLAPGGQGALAFSVEPQSDQVFLNAWYSGAASADVGLEFPAGGGNTCITFRIVNGQMQNIQSNCGRMGLRPGDPPLYFGILSPYQQFLNFGQVVSLPNNPTNNDKSLLFAVYAYGDWLLEGAWRVALYNTASASARYDAWMVAGPGFSNADPSMRVGIPGTARNAITVGAYVTKKEWTAASGEQVALPITVGDIAAFSSNGPTRDGRQKPEITAPGQEICSALSGQAALGAFGSAYYTPLQICQDGRHGIMQGTSMAAPHVAGAVALLFGLNRSLDAAQLRDLLTRNARADTFTGSVPNGRWGFGKLDLLAAANALSPNPPPNTYTIAGRVTASAGTAVAGVTLSDNAGHTTTTDAGGAYTLSGLAAGSYTLTPARSGCTFTPASRSVSLPPSATGRDFTATCSTNPPPTPAPNVVVNGDFEQGKGVGWSVSSMQWHDVIKTGAAHGGTWLAELGDGTSGGSGESAQIYQTITVPTESATLTYWYKITGAGGCSYPKAAVILGAWTLKEYPLCGTTATNGWVQETVNLAEYVGQTLKLTFFVKTEMLVGGTTFYVDDVVVSQGAPVTPPPPQPSDTIVNGDFESGPGVGWISSSLQGRQLIDQGMAHGGTWRAVLGNINYETASIAQTVRIPAAGATLEYWYKISSADYCVYDRGFVSVETGSSSSDLKTYLLCKTSVTDAYVRDEVSLAAYAGQTVNLKFRLANDAENLSTFYVDDVVMRSNGTPPPATYTISGRVTASSAGLAGVIVSDNAGHSATTDASGSYALGGLAAGTYTLTPARSGCTFTPASRTVNLSQNATGQDFMATCTTNPPATYTISGRVTASGGMGVPGVNLSDNAGHSTATDASGNYTLNGLAAGGYTVTPARSGCTFSPASRAVSVPPDASGQDFTATCATGGTRVKIMPGSTIASLSGTFKVDIAVEAVANLASYQTTLVYDPAIVQATAASQGTFLGSTGRTVMPLPPAIDNAAGRISVGAITMGDAAGANGAGVLATITFQPKAQGTSALHLQDLILTDPSGSDLPAITEDGQVRVSNCFGDFNGDGRVDIRDLQTAASHWNCSSGQACYDARFDVVADGKIDIRDLQRVAAAWNTTCSSGSQMQQPLAAADWPAQAAAVSMGLLPASVQVAPGSLFTQTIRLQDVAGLGAFQTDVTFNPAVVQAEAVTIGSLLGSTGRIVTPVGPIIDNSTGRITLGAFSFGEQAGVTGSGDVAAIRFRALGAGESALTFEQVVLADVQGNGLSLGTASGSTAVVGAGPAHKVLLPLIQQRR